LKLKVRDEQRPLQPVPFTVVTHVDGTREIQMPDGTIAKAATDWRDEDGNWAILDEYNATGSDTSTKRNAPDEIPVNMDALIAKMPKLKLYVEQLHAGVPLSVLRSRISGEMGVDTAAVFTDVAQGTRTEPEHEPDELQGSTSEKHGRLGKDAWNAPKLVARCGDIARPGYNSGAAHEYMDAPDVLGEKIRILAGLIRKARRFVIYAGAGLSTASGIGDYATKAGAGGVLAQIREKAVAPKPISPYSAKPNLGHRVIAAMAKEGLVWRFVQQNHDGLPQKAGVPQKVINEIHGGWFDPSNPVVAMSGTLREDLFADLLHCEQESDLVLALGSSLCGMNSDRLVSTCASKARRSVPTDPVLGSVIVSLQRTPHDANSSLRIFATIDDVLESLATELSLSVGSANENVVFSVPEHHLPFGAEEDVFLVPYDEQGKLSSQGERRMLDLRLNAKLTIAIGKNRGQQASVLGKNADGHYRIAVHHDSANNWNEVRLLGRWWPSAAVAGEVRQIPLLG
jgi:hypothetical protein